MGSLSSPTPAFRRLLALGFAASFLLPGCGYSLRTSRTASRLQAAGVSRIYIHPVRNQTLRPAVENAVYSQLVRMLSSTPGVRPVNSPELADAEMEGVVLIAERTVSGEIKASDLNPKQVGSAQLLVASEYQARLDCQFSLRSAGRRSEIWSGTFSRARPFPANSQVGPLGSTGALINESEFERALVEVSGDMMGDVRNAMMQDF